MQDQAKELLSLVDNSPEWKTYVKDGQFYIQCVPPSPKESDPRWIEVDNIFPNVEIHDHHIFINMDEPHIFQCVFIAIAIISGYQVSCDDSFNHMIYTGTK